MRISTIAYIFKQGFKNIWRNLRFSLASISTMAACIFLFGLFLALVMNFNHIVHSAEEGIAILVYFDEGITQDQIDEIGRELEDRPEVAEIDYISADEAWEAYSKVYLGEDNAELAEGFMQDNPLANSSRYDVYLDNVEGQEELVSFAESLDGVRKVEQSEAAADVLSTFNRLIGYVSIAIVVILLAVAVGGALCFHMSRKSAVPINRILKETSRILKGKEQAEQAEGGLNGVFQSLLRNSSELGEVLESQKPLVRNAFFGRLIFGDYIAEEEILRTARYLGIELEKRKYWIVIFRFGAMEKEQSENNSLQNTCNLALMKILEQQYKEGFHMNSGEDRTVMMMSISESEKLS